MPTRTYSRSEHRFFDGLASFLAGIASVGVAFEVQAKHPTRPYGPADHLTIEGVKAVSGREFRFYPKDLLDTLAANGWPSDLVIEELQLSTQPPPHAMWLSGLTGVHGSLIASAFIKYFEDYRPSIELKFGKDPYSWPSCWNFARVVRNALSHGGAVNFVNSNAKPVSWTTLTYSPAQNGRPLLYNDMTSVELILLLEDMDAQI
jgi:hypothetical protein